MYRLFHSLTKKISTKIVISLILLFSITITTILCSIVIRVTNDNIKVTKKHLNMLSTSIFHNVRNIMLTGNSHKTKDIEKEARLIDGVETLNIVKSQALLELYKTDETFTKNKDIIKTFHTKKNNIVEIQNDKEHLLRMIQPMIASQKCTSCHTNQKVGDVIGVIDLTFSLHSSDENLEDIIKSIVITSIILVLLTLIIIFIIVHKATAPIQGLKKGFQRLLSSEQSYKELKLRVRSSDEISDVAKLFNQYMDKLQKDLQKDVEQFSSSILNSQSNIIISTNRLTKSLQTANKAFLEFFDVIGINEFQDSYGKCICETFSEEFEDKYVTKYNGDEDWYDYINNRPNQTHKVLIKKDNKNFIFKINTSKFTLNEEEFNAAILTDITELEKVKDELLDINTNLEDKVQKEVEKNKQHELLLLKKEKIAALGEMMDAIAHQWKQPLNLISVVVDNLEVQIALGETISQNDIEESNQVIHHQIDHLVNTIDEFRQFFRPNQKSITTNLKVSLDSVVGLMKSVITKNNIELLINCDETLEYKLIETEFKHIFINLISNSKDAFIEHLIENRKIEIDVIKNDSSLIITIQDNAKGIKESVIKDIFKANVTTKEQDKGTGIGLYLVKQIIEKLNGSIQVNNTLENNKILGAKFTIVLPL